MTQTWRWPSWPAPDLNPTWTWTWLGKRILFYFNHLRTQLLGVCSTISPVGPAHGLFGGRFIVAFFASLASVVHKGISVALVLHVYAKDDHSSLSKIAFVLLLFTPQILMSLFCTIGFSKKSFEVILDHVDLIMQPAGMSLSCWQKMAQFSERRKTPLK